MRRQWKSRADPSCCLLSCIESTVLAGSDADAHHSGTSILHDRANVCKVKVDEARDGDEVGNALDALTKRVISDAERIEHGRFLVDNLEKTVVRDDDERVNVLRKKIDALLGLVATSATLERERLRDDTDGQRADFLTSDLGNDGRRARARAAAFTSGDEDHVGLGQSLADLVAGLFGCLRAHFGVGTSAEATGKILADMNGLVRIGHKKRLTIGVDGDELDALHTSLDHAVNGIRTATANADDLDNRQMLGAQIVWHCFLHTWVLLFSCVCCGHCA